MMRETTKMNTLEMHFMALGFTLLFAGAPAPAQALPDGPGKQEVASLCAGCHDMRPIERSVG